MSKILEIATAPAAYRYNSNELLEFMDQFFDDPIGLRKLKYIWRESGIDSKYSVLPDFKTGADRKLFKDQSAEPTTLKRMQVFQVEALDLALNAARKVLNQHALEPAKIDAIVVVSCTGLTAPGLEIKLAEKLGLSSKVDRHAVNFMGCYAAFHGLRLADLICGAATGKRVLVVCVELCSLHFRNTTSDDNLLSTTLFSDGAAAVIVGSDDVEGGALAIEGFHSSLIPEGQEDMAWNLGNFGFEMILNRNVPKHIEQNMAKAFHETLDKHHVQRVDIDAFAIHPGGKNVLGAFANALEANNGELDSSHSILEQYGNMSSCSVLYVLEDILKKQAVEKGVYAAAFGPGLTVESAVLRPIQS